MRRIRILHVITTTLGGAGEHVRQLTEGLSKERFEVYVAFSPGAALDAAFLANADLKVIPIQMDRKASLATSFRALVELVKLMRRERFDIVQTHTSVAGVLGRIAARIARVPITIHMVHAYASHDFVPPIKRRLYLAIERGLDALTDHYIVGSRSMLRKGIERGIIGHGKADLIYYSLDLARFDADLRANPHDLRCELNIPAQHAVVGIVGRLEPQKGVEFFLDAAAQIAAVHPACTFLVVGDGPQRTYLENMAKSLGIQEKTLFLGWRQDIPQIMKTLDVLVVSSRWEAFGIVNLEAMAAGKPVVGTDVEGIPEVVVHGVTGTIVPPGNASAISRAVLDILHNPDRGRRMGIAGRQRVESLFDSSKMVAQHEELYMRLLSDVLHSHPVL